MLRILTNNCLRMVSFHSGSKARDRYPRAGEVNQTHQETVSVPFINEQSRIRRNSVQLASLRLRLILNEDPWFEDDEITSSSSSLFARFL